MEHKVDQLLQRGLSIIFQLSKPFMKEWKEVLATLKYRKDSLVDEFNVMIQIAFQQVFLDKIPSVDSFILSLLTEWQNRFASKYDENESIYLLTTIENMFHKLLTERKSSTFLDHQAVQSVFSRILDQTLLTRDLEDRNEKWVKNIISTNIIQMEWIAVINKQEEYQVESVVCSEQNQVDSHLIDMSTSLKASQIDHLSMAIARLLGTNSDGDTILRIPCLNDTLLIGLQNSSVAVTDYEIEFIRGMYLRQLKLRHLESKLEWKDASLLFLQHLLRARGADKAVKAISEGLVEYMPFNRCALFMYNHYEGKGIGVSGYNVSNPSVQQIKEEIFKLPLIKKYGHSLNHSQPLYFANAAQVLPKKYVQEYKLKSLVVLPIFVPTKSKLIGIALLDKGEDSQFDVSIQTLTTLIKFGHYAGELLFSIRDEALQQFGNANGVLTQREKEVLKLIADGATINEAATTLHLSSYTVRDYISIIIQKLAAKNRTDAAVKAIKMNLIS
ncbi:LuxR C-terminal-related transcriptional regulator [Bacillus sp. sid0103]|uniref:LuxR C-terminal-related transcriptional regulator n=1 Tax=Bacillus sp. sid0103 TaxID=2856337 RepID=UPI001C449DF5|nr:LuxR C-terminal-related transcriptional regulator [Bacillus sp. sid0103]MBV7506352.1 LuxR C-terminal-related transcriptional regulator [Bacillus sp. sid0103]